MNADLCPPMPIGSGNEDENAGTEGETAEGGKKKNDDDEEDYFEDSEVDDGG